MIDPTAAWLGGAAVARLRSLDSAADPAAAAAALVADAEWVAAILSPLLAAPDTPWPAAARRAGARATLLLHRGDAASLGLTMIGAGAGRADRVIAGGRLMLARVMAGRGVAERRAAGPAGADFVAGDAPPLGPPRAERFGTGAILTLDGRSDAWRLRVHGPAAVLLTLTLHADAAMLAREYALPAGTLARVTALEGEAARAAMLTAMMAALPLAAARDGYAAASRHPAFFVRWQAMRGWLARDPHGALRGLDDMAAGDPHPEVRLAARAAREQVAPCPS